MVREGIPMDKVLEVLKERYGEKVASVRKIAKTLGISRPDVQKYLDLSASLGIRHWPLNEAEGEKARLRAALYPEKEQESRTGCVIPDWKEVEKELTARKKSGVTLWLLWEEYRGREPEGLGYSQFCRLYRCWRKRQDIPIRRGRSCTSTTRGPRSGSTRREESPNGCVCSWRLWGGHPTPSPMRPGTCGRPPGSWRTGRPSSIWVAFRPSSFRTGPRRRSSPGSGSSPGFIRPFRPWRSITALRSPRHGREKPGTKAP